MEIIGTERDEFEIFLAEDFYQVGEILETGLFEKNTEVLNKTLLDEHDLVLYSLAYPALIGEELENAINHFKFLRRYGL